MISSAVDPPDLAATRQRIFLALFIALAVAVNTLETLLPSPAPWFRLGLANLFAVTALFLYGARAAWIVTLARIGIAALLLGRLFSPGFLLALCGGAAATSLMTGAKALCGRHLGPVGASALGASGHAAGQMVMAWLVLLRHDGLWLLFPFLLLFSLFAGIANGLAADLLLEFLCRQPAFSGRKKESADPPPG